MGPPPLAARPGPPAGRSELGNPESDLSPPRGTARRGPRSSVACSGGAGTRGVLSGKPLHAKDAFGEAWGGGEGPREEDRGAARRVPAAGFPDPRIPRTGASRTACSRASARADPLVAGDPLGRVGAHPRELPLYSCERGGAAGAGEGTATLKVRRSALLR